MAVSRRKMQGTSTRPSRPASPVAACRALMTVVLTPSVGRMRRCGRSGLPSFTRLESQAASAPSLEQQLNRRALVPWPRRTSAASARGRHRSRSPAAPCSSRDCTDVGAASRGRNHQGRRRSASSRVDACARLQQQVDRRRRSRCVAATSSGVSAPLRVAASEVGAGAEQQRGEAGVVVVRRPVQRRHAVALGLVDVGLRRQEPSHLVRVADAARHRRCRWRSRLAPLPSDTRARPLSASSASPVDAPLLSRLRSRARRCCRRCSRHRRPRGVQGGQEHVRHRRALRRLTVQVALQLTVGMAGEEQRQAPCEWRLPSAIGLP